jgi:hypothetical protein
MDEIVIDENNFSQYFRDARTSKPESGDILVFYKSGAELMNGELKEQMIYALYHEKIGAQKAIQLFMKLGGATHHESIKVVKAMNDDLMSGMTNEEVLNKSYEFILQLSFYTKKEYVPKNDPHWEVIQLKNFVEKTVE